LAKSKTNELDIVGSKTVKRVYIILSWIICDLTHIFPLHLHSFSSAMKSSNLSFPKNRILPTLKYFLALY